MSEYVGFGWRDRNAKKVSGRAPDPLSGNSAGATFAHVHAAMRVLQVSHITYHLFQSSRKERNDVALGWWRLLLRHGLAHVSQDQRVRAILPAAYCPAV